MLKHFSLKMRVLFLAALVLLIVAPVAVQGQQMLENSYNDGDVFFQYPRSFELDEDNLTLSNLTGSLSITLKEPSQLFVDSPVDEALTKILRARGTEHGEVTTVDVAYGAATRTLAQTELDDGTQVFAVQFAGDTGTGWATVTEESAGMMALQRATVHAIIASYNSADYACTVWSPGEEAARVRVGPGINRTVVTYLPVEQNFTPLGQSTDEDDTLWYQFDTEQAAPTSLINEAWVSASDLESMGDCSNVPDAEAPELVPIEPADEGEGAEG